MADGYDAACAAERRRALLHRYTLAFDLVRGLDVLDIPSRDGQGAMVLAAAARTVVGVDWDLTSVRDAAARHAAMNVSFISGTSLRIPLDDKSVDLVTAFEALDGIDDHDAFLAEIARVLRPNGRVLISASNTRALAHGAAKDGPARGLYFDEFRDLVRNWFPHCRMYAQRSAGASVLQPVGGPVGDARCLTPETADGTLRYRAIPEPTSFVAWCSRADSRPVAASLDSVFVDTREQPPPAERDLPQAERAAAEIAPAVVQPEAAPVAAPAAPPPAATVADSRSAAPIVVAEESARIERPGDARERMAEKAARLHRVALILARERNDLALVRRTQGQVAGTPTVDALGQTGSELARTLDELSAIRATIGQAIESNREVSEPRSVT